MRKIYLPLVLASFLQTLPAAHADITSAAFSDDDVANAVIKLQPKAAILEAPDSIQSSATNETFIEASSSTSTTLVNKEYADTKVWGKLCNIVNTPNGQYKWSINRYNLEDDSVETIFGVSNNRKIQSVACDPSGYEVIFSMKETQGGDYEIYSLSPGEENSLSKITDNDTDDVDVTASWDFTTFAWQQRLADGRQAVLLTRFTPENDYELVTKSLASASPFVQPSLSANGKWLTFVQLRPSFFAVMRYNIESNKYLEIRKIPRRKRLFHPSISNDGNLIGWSENKSQNRYMVKNLADNTLTQLLNNSNGIEHASISAQGDLVVYSVNADTKRQTYMTNLESLSTTRVGGILYGDNRYLGSNWLGTSIQDFQPEEISGQVFVGVDDPFVLAFSSAGNGIEFSNGDGEYSDNPDAYSADFNWLVDSGELLVEYVDEEHGSVNVSKVSVENNKYTLIGEDSDGDGGIADLYKALPLDLDELDGKIISLDMSADSSCSAMTFAFTGSDAHQLQVCSDLTFGIKSDVYTAAVSNNFENIIVMSNADELEGDGELSWILVEGSIDDGQGKVAIVVKDSNGNFEFVSVTDFVLVEEEASLPNLSNLIVGKTLYQHVFLDGQDGVSTFTFETDGSLVMKDLGQSTEVVTYHIDGNSLYLVEGTSQEEKPAIEINDTYIVFRDELNPDGETTTMYFTEADALAGPIDNDDRNQNGNGAPEVTDFEFFDDGNNTGQITIRFSEDMQNEYATSGEYVPFSSFWYNSRTFIIGFSSYTPGGSITFKTHGFKTIDGRALAEDYTFVFPE